MDSAAQPASSDASIRATDADAAFLRRALELAEAGEGLASPNPLVGAVVVRDGKVLGEGTYTYDGLKHAEVLALEQAGDAARGASVYVNLEPCSHHGRTPPCAEALIRAGIARVVAGMRDPHPLVSGRGFARLREAGVAVEEGLLGEQCRRLNEHFARYIRGGVFVTLKAALTLDGRIAAPKKAGGVSERFTCAESLACVQRLRHRHDALVTGIGTVLADDPLLTDRSGLPRRRPLLRVVMDSTLRLSPASRLAESARDDLLVACGPQAPAERARELQRRGVEVLRLADDRGAARPPWPALLAELRRREIASVLLEAGAALNAGALESGLVDKVVLFYAPKLLGGADAPPLFAGPGFRTLAGAVPVRITELRHSGDDILVEGYLRDVYGDH